MKGLDRLIAMRRQGFRPLAVVLDESLYDSQNLPNWIQYEKTDVPELTDLRSLVGMIVSVHGKDQDTVNRWSKAVLTAGATTVLTMVYSWRGEWFKAQHEALRVNGVDQ